MRNLTPWTLKKPSLLHHFGKVLGRGGSIAGGGKRGGHHIGGGGTARRGTWNIYIYIYMSAVQKLFVKAY